MKVLFNVTRNGKKFIVARSKSYHYYIALSLNGERVTAWKRTTLATINEYFRKVETA